MASYQRIFKVVFLLLLLLLSIAGPILFLHINRRLNVDVITSFRFPPVLVRSTTTKAATKVILFWVPYFSERHYGFGLGAEPFSRAGCLVGACETTDDRSRLTDSDAVVFHLSNVDGGDLPVLRYDDQRWIFLTMESPTNTAFARTGRPITDLRPLDGHFNWTMTYRRDSDIRLPYFDVVNRTSTTKTMSKNKNIRKRLVSWLVSNCRTTSKRESYAHALRTHVPIDVYGACGRPCRPRSKCGQLALDDHKFYLSFENSVCRDYVTEKLSNALGHVEDDVVPVVYGGADYASIAPPRSYIDVRDYASPAHLARHLVQLDMNETAFQEFLEWKSAYSIVTGGQVVERAFCDLCAALHDVQRPKKTYDTLHRWWVELANCSTDVPLGYPRLMHRMKLANLELAHGFPRGT